MAVYIELILCMFKQQFQYRSSIWLRMAGDIVHLYIQICIWRVLLPEETAWKEMALYVIGVYLIQRLTYSDIAANMAEKVKDGSIALTLVRPISMRRHFLCEQIGTNLFGFLFRGIPLAAVFLTVFKVPAKPSYALLFIASMACAVVLVFYFQYFIGLFVFWFKDGTYARMITNGLMDLFSGNTIPLWFYPGFLRAFCNVLPLRYMIFEPASILVGRYTVEGAVRAVGVQLIWIAVLFLAQHLVWKKVQSAIVIQGG